MYWNHAPESCTGIMYWNHVLESGYRPALISSSLSLSFSLHIFFFRSGNISSVLIFKQTKKLGINLLLEGFAADLCYFNTEVL